MPARLTLLLIALTATVLLALPGVALADSFDPDPGSILAPSAPSPPPSIPNQSQEGDTLDGYEGAWDSGTILTYKWLRCESDKSTCVATGDTDLSYTLASADVGKIVKLRVTGTNGLDSRQADSNEIGPIVQAPVPPSPPTAPPSITGTAQENEVLTGDRGAWDATAVSFTYEWFRCDLATCETTGDTDLSHTLTADDVGKTIKLRVTGRSATNGTTEADSDSFGPIAPAPPGPTPTPTPATSPPASTGPPATTSPPPAKQSKPAPTLKRLSPFPLLVIGGRVSGSVTVFSSVSLNRMPRGATVRISCTGRSCPFARSATTLRKGSKMTLVSLQRSLSAGTVITITVRKGKTLGKYTRLRIRRGTAPARVDRCVRPGSSKPVACK